MPIFQNIEQLSRVGAHASLTALLDMLVEKSSSKATQTSILLSLDV